MNTNLTILEELETKFTVAEILVRIYQLLDSEEIDKATKAYLTELSGFMTQGFLHDNYYRVGKQDFRTLRAWTKRWVRNPKIVEVKRVENLTPERIEEIKKICFERQLVLMDQAIAKREAQLKRLQAKHDSLKYLISPS